MDVEVNQLLLCSLIIDFLAINCLQILGFVSSDDYYHAIQFHLTVLLLLVFIHFIACSSLCFHVFHSNLQQLQIDFQIYYSIQVNILFDLALLLPNLYYFLKLILSVPNVEIPYLNLIFLILIQAIITEFLKRMQLFGILEVLKPVVVESYY